MARRALLTQRGPLRKAAISKEAELREPSERRQASQNEELTVKITTGFVGREQEFIELFAATFTASEGPDEGALIGDLVRDLLAETPTKDIRVFCAEDEGHAIGAAVFTRLTLCVPKTSSCLSS